MGIGGAGARTNERWVADWPGVKADMLASSYLVEWGRIHGISDCVFMEARCKDVADSVVASTVQAVLGAVHKDGGRAPLYRVMRRLNLLNHVALGREPAFLPPSLVCSVANVVGVGGPHEPENPPL